MNLKALSAAALLCMSACANASVLTFESLGVPGGVSQPGISSSGFQFSDNVAVVDVSPDSMFGEGTNGAHSGMYASMNDFGSAMQMTRIGGGLMNVSSLWIHGWLGWSEEVVIEGYRDGAAVQVVNYIFGENWDAVALNFNNIDMLSLSSHGLFFVDDINAVAQNPNPGTVPEPATTILFGAALVGLAFARKRRS